MPICGAVDIMALKSWLKGSTSVSSPGVTAGAAMLILFI